MERTKIIPVLMHGDASFTGQGIFETLGLSELPAGASAARSTSSSINQIGFTTTPERRPFTPYPTDVAKAIQHLHVKRG